jgi:hypothetical protein
MMIVPETGGATGGVVQIGGDELPAKPAAAPQAAATKAAVLEKKEASEFHLQRSNLRPSIAGVSVGRGFDSPRMNARVYAKAKKEAAPPAQKTREARPELPTITRARDLSTPLPQKDIFVPSLLDPEVVPEHPFWDAERERRVMTSGLVAVAGIIYLLFAMGVFNSMFGSARVENDQPRR